MSNKILEEDDFVDVVKIRKGGPNGAASKVHVMAYAAGVAVPTSLHPALPGGAGCCRGNVLHLAEEPVPGRGNQVVAVVLQGAVYQ